MRPQPTEAICDAARSPATGETTALVARAQIFQGIDAAVVAAVVRQLRPAHFTRQQLIYREGEPGAELYIVTAGTVKVGRTSTHGRSHLLTVAGPADMFGELSLLDPGPRTATATALTTVDAMVMGRDTLREWITEHPQITERLLRILARRLRRTNHDLSDLIFTDVAGRVAKYLLRLTQQFGVHVDGATHVEHHLTQDELAQLAGTSRETVNKVLADFATRGWIHGVGTTIVVCDLDALRRRSRAVDDAHG